MIVSENACNDAGLYSLLREDESSHGYQSALQHVDSCTACQVRLEQMAAESGLWQEAQEVLTSSHEPATGSAKADELAFPLNRRPVAWSESVAKALLAPPSHPELLGRIGRYDVERLIGSGGMGVVFKAYDTELNRPVAVKLLAPYLAESGSARNRFAREARSAAGVVDDHVVPIYNVESENDPPFLVMQYVAGGSLQETLDRNGPLEVGEILRIGMQTAKGLAAAHAQGLIHRDVKPSNILLDEGVERALLTDFGLARAEDDACLTRSGFHPGTPHYMSPEQVRGDAIDGRSDLFGLGCVLYALCTGHPPFRAETSYAVLRRITDDTARPIRQLNPDIPDWLESIVMKLLSKSREGRFGSAEQVAELLEDCLAHVQHPTATPLPKRVEPLTQRLPLALSGGSGRKVWRHWFYIGFAAFSLLFAGFLVVLEMNKGTLTIESDADDVPIRIMQGDDVVEVLTVNKGTESVQIAAGNYFVEIDGEFDGVVVDKGLVSLKRRGEERVKLSLSSVELAATPVKPAANENSINFDSLEDLPIDTQVHVVGCYGPVNHQPIEVFVKSTGKPMVIVLNCYSVANWNWNVDPDADVRGVILSGYNAQQFSHSAPRKGIPTIINTYFPMKGGIEKPEREERSKAFFLAHSPLEEKEFEKMLNRVDRLTERKVTSFQTIAEAKEFVIDGKRGLEELEIAKRWLAFAPGQDKNSEEFIIIDYRLHELLLDRQRPTPTKQFAEKMDALGIPRLTQDVAVIQETKKESNAVGPAAEKQATAPSPEPFASSPHDFGIDSGSTTGNLLTGTWEIEISSPGKPKRSGIAAFAGNGGMIAASGDETVPLQFTYDIQPNFPQPEEAPFWIDLYATAGAADGGPSRWHGIVEASRSSIALCFAREDQIKPHGRPASIKDADLDVFVKVVFLKRTGSDEESNAVDTPAPTNASTSATISVDGKNRIVVLKGDKESVELTADSLNAMMNQPHSAAKERGADEAVMDKRETEPPRN
ncbi:Serine/threonine-protein kinase PrkC [Roseimaritima multifibrata]|uniref:Serine/threonine-protein kinase PrkC n=1 Tax=Roseimaritima multifibrata TaxID=1930274 RepID=A0A517MMV0_9BACT|nr:serine/threonine-protein kinase [Roseimaritima multifibrata]QDS96194.1 Serine/threonine-protein kinase PrkC [Roseimaritima multifibrata]